jgi:hypothetical protein
VTPAGSVSSTVVSPLVGAEPEFVTLIVHVPFVPAANVPACDLLIPTFGAFTTVGSEARSFEGSRSPVVLTLAKFVTPGAVLAATAAVKLNDAVPPTPIEPGRIAVTIWPFALKLHPEPLAETYVMPAGSVSSTVVIPLVGAEPEFVTVMAQVPFTPAVKAPVCDLASPRFGTAAGFTTVGSEARSFEGFVSPEVLTLAEFVTPGTAPAPIAPVRLNEALPLTAIEPGNVAVTICPLVLKLQPAPVADT